MLSYGLINEVLKYLLCEVYCSFERVRGYLTYLRVLFELQKEGKVIVKEAKILKPTEPESDCEYGLELFISFKRAEERVGKEEEENGKE